MSVTEHSSREFVSPKTWKRILARYSPAAKFNPRLIFRSGDKWLFQINAESTVDITNWKLYWNIEGHTILKTMDELWELAKKREN